ncbi:hypothetical protein ACFQZ4_38060 [Catellatospora coxensis]
MRERRDLGHLRRVEQVLAGVLAQRLGEVHEVAEAVDPVVDALGAAAVAAEPGQVAVHRRTAAVEHGGQPGGVGGEPRSSARAAMPAAPAHTASQLLA